MGERAVENRIRKLKALEEQIRGLEQQKEALQEEIKADMENKGIDEMHTGSFIVRWKSVLINVFG